MPDKTPPAEARIPIAEESLAISKRELERGRVRVALTTETERVVARETLRGRRIEVERVPVGRMLEEGEAPPQARRDGDLLVVPILEETAVVVKRLVLREEVRLRFVATEAPFEQEVELRRQRGTVERTPSDIASRKQRAMTRTVTALFETAEAAERAAYDLATRVGGVRGEVLRSNEAERLNGVAVPAEDAATLREHLRRGGAVVHAEVPEARFTEVADALEHSGALDMDEREAAWRREGWQATSAPAAPAARPADEEVIPVVEEQLRVGKRETAHGRVRLRAYIVETPVEEQVTLHQEHVDIQRRPVDRPVGADEALFQDRTIEATERAEEAVVAKEARVVEEVVLRKQAEDRTETVRDTVRRTEVKVEDERLRDAARKGSPTPDKA